MPCVNQVYAAAITFSIYIITNLRLLRTDKLSVLCNYCFGISLVLISFYIIPYAGGDNDLAFQLK